MYLNDGFEGGEFIFAHPNGTQQVRLVFILLYVLIQNSFEAIAFAISFYVALISSCVDLGFPPKYLQGSVPRMKPVEEPEPAIRSGCSSHTISQFARQFQFQHSSFQ